jgi:hypothetical protein
MSDRSSDRPTVDLYVATGKTALWERQGSVIDELDRLETAEAIDGYRVRVWSGLVPTDGPLSETAFHRSAARAAREFEAWADDHERPVEVPIERESVASELTGTEYHVLRPPAVCVALYRDGDLTAVYPCDVEGDRHSIPDVLDRIGDRDHPLEAADVASGPVR